MKHREEIERLLQRIHSLLADETEGLSTATVIDEAMIRAALKDMEQYPFLLTKDDVRKLLGVDKRTVIDMWPNLATIGGERSRVPKVVLIDYLLRQGRERSTNQDLNR